MSYERAMGTDEVPTGIDLAVPVGPPTVQPSAPDPVRLEMRALTPGLPDRVGAFVQNMTGSEQIGSAASCVTAGVVPVSADINLRNAFTWGALAPWTAALLVYGYKMRGGSEKSEAIKYGAATLVGLPLVMCAVYRRIPDRLF